MTPCRWHTLPYIFPAFAGEHCILVQPNMPTPSSSSAAPALSLFSSVRSLWHFYTTVFRALSKPWFAHNTYTGNACGCTGCMRAVPPFLATWEVYGGHVLPPRSSVRHASPHLPHDLIDLSSTPFFSTDSIHLRLPAAAHHHFKPILPCAYSTRYTGLNTRGGTGRRAHGYKTGINRTNLQATRQPQTTCGTSAHHRHWQVKHGVGHSSRRRTPACSRLITYDYLLPTPPRTISLHLRTPPTMSRVAKRLKLCIGRA